MGDRAVAVSRDTPAEPKASDRLASLTLMVSAEQSEALRRLARERQTSVGAVGRDAIRAYLATVAS